MSTVLSEQRPGLAAFVSGDIRVNNYWREQALASFQIHHLGCVVWFTHNWKHVTFFPFECLSYSCPCQKCHLWYHLIIETPFPVVSTVTHKGRCFIERHPSLTQSDFELNSRFLLSLDSFSTRKCVQRFDVASSSFCSCKFCFSFFWKNDNYFLILTTN